MRAAVVGLVVAGVLLGAAEGRAQEASEAAGWFTGNVSIMSDYPFRGISQTLEEPSIQGGVDLIHPSGLYVGAWGASVNFGEDLTLGPRATMELDVYGGWAADLGGLATVDVGAIYYAYPGAHHGRHYDFIEVGLGASRSLGPLATKVQAKYSPDFYAASGNAMFYGLNLGLPVSLVTVNGSLGYQEIEENSVFGAPDYTTWGLGATVGVAGFGISGTYFGTDIDEGECFGGSDLCEGRFVVGVSRAM